MERAMTASEAEQFTSRREMISEARRHLEGLLRREQRIHIPGTWDEEYMQHSRTLRSMLRALSRYYADQAYLFGTNQVGDLVTILPPGQCPGNWTRIPKSRLPTPDYVETMMSFIYSARTFRF